MVTLTGAKTLAYLLALLILGYGIFFACLAPKTRKELGYQPVLVAGTLNALSFLLPTLLLVNVAFFLLPILIVRKREQAGLFFITGMLTTAALTQYLRVGGAYVFPGYTVHVSLAVGCFFAFLMKGGRVGKGRNFAADLPALLIVLLVFIGGARGTPGTQWLREVAAASFVWALPYYLVTRSLSSPEGVRKACLWLGATGAMLSLVVLFEMASLWSLFQPLDFKFDIGRSGATYKIRLGFMRAQGPMVEPTATGIALVFCLGGALASRAGYRNGSLYTVACLIIAVGLLAPQSRGGWLGAAILLILFGIFRVAPGKAGRLAAPALLAMPLAWAVLSYGAGEKETSGTIDYRARLWDRGTSEFLRSPIFGQDRPGLLARMKDLTQGEGIIDFVNSHLYFALVGGAIGLFAFLYAFLGTALNLWRRRKQFPAKSFERDNAAFCFAVLLAAVVMFGFTSFMETGGILVIITCGFAGTLLAGAKKKKPSRPRTPFLQPAGMPATTSAGANAAEDR